jgi:hypothetical protein
VAAGVTVRGSTGELHVLGPTGTTVVVRDAVGRTVAEGVIDGFGDRLALLGVTDRVRGRGGLLVRPAPPGRHDVVLGGSDDAVAVEVLADGEVPADYTERVLGQQLDVGYGYVEVRDGLTLGCNVAVPDPTRFGPGPYPTLIQYSGYHPSRPGFLTGDPAQDTTLNTEANVCLHLGFAVVGVNMRGSGGSGGAFDLFSRLAGLDGHDVVEVVARQPWCARGPDGELQVGMIGRSMPGFSQLLVAATQPPSLKAIAPAAVAGRPYVCCYPGGIPNAWLIPRMGFWEVEPPPVDDAIIGGGEVEGSRYDYYDAWLVEHIEGRDDQRAAENQLLRGHNRDLAAAADEGRFADHEVHHRHEVMEWVRHVEAPTLLMGTWQDQDSGPGFTDLPGRFPPTTPVSVLFANGTHESSRLPGFLRHWVAFLGVHLAGHAPTWTEEALAYLEACGVPGDPPPPVVPGPPTVQVDMTPGGTGAPAVIVQLDVGAGAPTSPGAPYPAAELRLPSWPPPVEVARLHLRSGGGLSTREPLAGDPSTTWLYDPRAKPVASAGGGFDINDALPAYDWRPLPAGHAAAFLGDPLEDDLLVLGAAALELWISCTAPDVDLEVTLSEVRPDGWETFVQNGWLRTSHRTLDERRSTELAPWPTHLEADACPLVPGEPTPVRIPIGASGHLFRVGSRIRVSVEAPGGNQPHWTFRPLWADGRAEGQVVEVTLLHDPEHPSALVLPVVEGHRPPGGWPPLPAPGALRRQPSRRYRPAGVVVDPERPLPPQDPADAPPRPQVAAVDELQVKQLQEGEPPPAAAPAPLVRVGWTRRAHRRGWRLAGGGCRRVRRLLGPSG